MIPLLKVTLRELWHLGMKLTPRDELWPLGVKWAPGLKGLCLPLRSSKGGECSLVGDNFAPKGELLPCGSPTLYTPWLPGVNSCCRHKKNRPLEPILEQRVKRLGQGFKRLGDSVTRPCSKTRTLGKELPRERAESALASYLKIVKVSQILGFYPRWKICINCDKKSVGLHFGRFISQTHLVTLFITSVAGVELADQDRGTELPDHRVPDALRRTVALHDRLEGGQGGQGPAVPCFDATPQSRPLGREIQQQSKASLGFGSSVARGQFYENYFRGFSPIFGKMEFS
jgi:hypothetical protein